jgi:hypothetical protein
MGAQNLRLNKKTAHTKFRKIEACNFKFFRCSNLAQIVEVTQVHSNVPRNVVRRDDGFDGPEVGRSASNKRRKEKDTPELVKASRSKSAYSAVGKGLFRSNFN